MTTRAELARRIAMVRRDIAWSVQLWVGTDASLGSELLSLQTQKARLDAHLTGYTVRPNERRQLREWVKF